MENGRGREERDRKSIKSRVRSSLGATSSLNTLGRKEENELQLSDKEGERETKARGKEEWPKEREMETEREKGSEGGERGGAESELFCRIRSIGSAVSFAPSVMSVCEGKHAIALADVTLLLGGDMPLDAGFCEYLCERAPEVRILSLLSLSLFV